MICVDFSLIGYDPTMSLILAGSLNAIAVHLKGLWPWGGDLKNDSVDHSVRIKFPLNCETILGKSLSDI